MSSKGFLVKQKESIVGFCLFVPAFKKIGNSNVNSDSVQQAEMEQEPRADLPLE